MINFGGIFALLFCAVSADNAHLEDIVPVANSFEGKQVRKCKLKVSVRDSMEIETLEVTSRVQLLPATQEYVVSTSKIELDSTREWVCKGNVCEISPSTYTSKVTTSGARSHTSQVASSLSRAACMTLMELNVNITVMARALGGDSSWQRVAFVSTNHRWRQNIIKSPRRPQELPSTGTLFHFFHMTPTRTPPIPSRPGSVSGTRVKSADQKWNEGMKSFETLYWGDWDTVRGFYAAVELPSKEITQRRGVHNRRDVYARWANILLAAAYAIQFRLPYLVLLDDGAAWPAIDELRRALAEADLPPPSSDRIVKLSKLGQGYVFPLQAAEQLVKVVYHVGVCTHPDSFIVDYMDVVHYMGIKYRTLGTGEKSPVAMHPVDFKYAAAWDNSWALMSLLLPDLSGDSAEPALKLFGSDKDRNFTRVVNRLMRNRGVELPKASPTPGVVGSKKVAALRDAHRKRAESLWRSGNPITEIGSGAKQAQAGSISQLGTSGSTYFPRRDKVKKKKPPAFHKQKNATKVQKPIPPPPSSFKGGNQGVDFKSTVAGILGGVVRLVTGGSDN